MGEAASKCRSDDKRIHVFKRYRIHHSQKLGAGNFGSTVVASDKCIKGRRVAAKIIPLGRVSEERLEREVHINKAAASRYVCSVYGSGVRKHEFVIFLELCAGGELYKLVEKQGTLSEVDARKYFVQMMSAVRHCHSIGIVHRDLKLENVLLTDDCSSVRIIDFGLAHEYPRISDGRYSETMLRHCCGSKAYCAPEVLAPRQGYSYPADVWSCGVALFAMLLGFFPVEEAASADWRFEKLREARRDGKCAASTVLQWYRRPQFLSRHALDLIDQMLEVDQRLRITAKQCLEHPWMVPGRKPSLRSKTAKQVIVDALNESSAAGRPRLPVTSSPKDDSWTSYVTASLTRVISGVTGIDLLTAREELDEFTGRPVYRGHELDARLQSVRMTHPIVPPFIERQSRFGHEDLL